MAGILGIYGVIVAALLNNVMKDLDYKKGYKFLAAGLSCGLSSLASGLAIGVAGDAGVRAYAQTDTIFVGMILILIFAEAIGLYGMIVAIIMISSSWVVWRLLQESHNEWTKDSMIDNMTVTKTRKH